MRAREWMRDRFWVLPSLLVLAGVVLAVLTAEAERLGIPTSWPSGLRVDPSAAGDILGVVAASMLTFVGVVFTLTLVALQLASAQLSPRVIRTFVRSGVTKAAFGIFLATFAYAVVAQVLEGARDNEPAQSRAVTMALVLVAASLAVFVVYVTATMKLLQVSWVITAVANETRAAVAANYPAADGYLQTNPPRLSADPRVVRLVARDGRGYRGSLGVVLGIDRARLVTLARRRRCVLELVVRVGEYVPTGGAVFAVHGPIPPSDDELLACVHLGRARTLYQDPSFGLRQLVDVASRHSRPPSTSRPPPCRSSTGSKTSCCGSRGGRNRLDCSPTTAVLCGWSSRCRPSTACLTWPSPRSPPTVRVLHRLPGGCWRPTTSWARPCPSGSAPGWRSEEPCWWPTSTRSPARGSGRWPCGRTGPAWADGNQGAGPWGLPGAWTLPGAAVVAALAPGADGAAAQPAYPTWWCCWLAGGC